MIMEDSALNIYLDEIGKGALLSDEEERQLSERIRQGDDRALSKLVEANLRFRQQIEKAIEQQAGLYQVPRDVKDEVVARQQSMPLSVDAPLGHRANMSLLSVLVNQDAPLADERVHSEAVEAAIEFALGSLDQRESWVVNAFFGIGQEHETMAEIAEDMDLKRERVRQIRDKAVRKLRKAYHRRLKELHKK